MLLYNQRSCVGRGDGKTLEERLISTCCTFHHFHWAVSEFYGCYYTDGGVQLGLGTLFMGEKGQQVVNLVYSLALLLWWIILISAWIHVQ